MRPIVVACLAIGCASASKGSLPSGWSNCAIDDPARVTCGLGLEGCEALRQALQRCKAPEIAWHTLLITADASGRLSEPCLVEEPPPAALSCVAEVLRDARSPGITAGSRVPLRIGVFPHRVLVPDGTGLDQPAIMQVIKEAIPRVARCVDEQRRIDPSLHGKLVFEWGIGADGKVTNVELLSQSFSSTHVASCLRALIGGLEFPAHERAASEPVIMPFKL